MIMTPQRDPEPADTSEWAADDFDALTHLVGTYTYAAAEETIYELYKVLNLEEHELGPELNKMIGEMAGEIAAGMVDYYREELAESERAGTWQVERVILERMRGNPKARPGSEHHQPRRE